MKHSRTDVRATWLANAKVLCTEAKSSTWIATTRLARKAEMRSAPSLLGAPPLIDRATSCSNNWSSRARAASARCRLRQAMIEGQARAGVLEAPFVVVGITRPRRKKGAHVVQACLRQAVEETATNSETYAADCAEVVERCCRRVAVGWTACTCLLRLR
jgi:hypothetical protein